MRIFSPKEISYDISSQWVKPDLSKGFFEVSNENPFNIEGIPTNIEITRLTLDKNSYSPGNTVKLSIDLKNTGTSKDILIQGSIKELGSHTIVNALKPISLKKFHWSNFSYKRVEQRWSKGR